MTESELFVLADQALNGVVAQVRDDQWAMDEAGPERFKGDLLGDDPKARFAEIVERAGAAAQALDDLDRTVHCSFGDFTARAYLWQVTSFRAFRTHDIARVIGVDPTLPPDLVQALWDEFLPRAE